MRNRSLLFALALASTVAGLAPPAHAKWVWVPPHANYNPYARRHFYVGGEGLGAVIVDQTGPDAFLDHGGGLGFFFGGRLSRWFALEFEWEGTYHGAPRIARGIYLIPGSQRMFLSGFTVAGKLFMAHHRVQPYFDFGGGGYVLGDRSDFFAAGPGFQVGGGCDVWLGTHFSIGGKLLYHGVALIDYDPGHDNTYISMFTFSVDFTGHF